MHDRAGPGDQPRKRRVIAKRAADGLERRVRDGQGPAMHQRPHLSPRSQQLRDQGLPDETRSAGDGDGCRHAM